MAEKIRIGVSSCLLGEKVRWNGDHKQDLYAKKILGKLFDCVPVCPEVEVGMGVPREPVHLLADKDTPRLVGTGTGKDWTEKMTRYSKHKIEDLFDLNGFVFKEGSPSCGISRIPIRSKTGKKLNAHGQGLFAKAFMATWPLIPAIDEQGLSDLKNRENFVVRVFSCFRLRRLLSEGFTKEALIKFHTCHKYLLLAHSKKHYQALNQMADKAEKTKDLEKKYSQLFMAALACKTTLKKNADVLQSMMVFLKNNIEEKQDILAKIADYRNERAPLIVPITQIRNHAIRHNITCLLDQVYLNPPNS